LFGQYVMTMGANMVTFICLACPLQERRAKEEETWIQLEREFRSLLLKRASIGPQRSQRIDDQVALDLGLCVHTGTDFPGVAPSASNKLDALRQQFIELQNEEIALQYQAAYYKSLLAWGKALNFWGGQTDANRRIREQINALPSLLQPGELDGFQW
jgi:hypothetical protein